MPELDKAQIKKDLELFSRSLIEITKILAQVNSRIIEIYGEL